MATMIFSQNRLADFNDRKPDAVTKMFIHYYPMVINQVKRVADITQDPNDLAQEVFVNILSGKSDFQRLDQLVLYIYKTTERTCQKNLRKETYRREKMKDIEKLYVDLEAWDREKERKRAAFDYLRYMAIEILARQCKQVFLLHYVDGLKIKEIANRLNLSVSTVANHINHGNRHLKMAVEKRGGRGEIYPALLLWILHAEYLLQNIFYENI